MSFKAFLKVKPARWVLCHLALWRVVEKLAEIGSYLDLADRVLDVGAGNCILCRELGRRGYESSQWTSKTSALSTRSCLLFTTARHFPSATIVSTWPWSSRYYTTPQIRMRFSRR